MSTITAPAAPSAPYYIGKGVTGSNGTTVVIFGHELPNDGDLGVSSTTGPLSIYDATTYFDASLVGPNHEMPVVLYSQSSLNITSDITVNTKWYRSRGNKLVFDFTKTFPMTPPAGQHYENFSVASWIGWLSDDIEEIYWDLPTYPEYREIQENGNYYAVMTISGGLNRTSPNLNFVVVGIPAQLVVENKRVDGFDYTLRLTNYFDSSNYIRVGLCTSPFTDGQTTAPSGITSWWLPPSTNSGCAVEGSISGLTDSVTFYGFAQAANGAYYNIGSPYNFIVKPIGTPVVSMEPIGNHTYTVSWYGVTGATKYVVWAVDLQGDSGTQYKGETSGSSLDITLDREYWMYSIIVVPYNGETLGDQGYYTIISQDETDPTISFAGISSTNNSITFSVSVFDPIPSNGRPSGIAGCWFYLWNGVEWIFYGNGTSPGNGSPLESFTYTGLDAGVSYTVGARSYDKHNNSSILLERSIETKSARPSDFYWDTAKVTGSAFNVTASEWNRFTSRINEFRLYKGLSTISFTNAPYADGKFYAFMFNQALNGIKEGTGYNTSISLPSVRSSGDPILASYLNNMRDALNSIP